jgi:hypothetical protein
VTAGVKTVRRRCRNFAVSIDLELKQADFLDMKTEWLQIGVGTAHVCEFSVDKISPLPDSVFGEKR